MIPVFFRDEMAADAHHFAPGARKPPLVVANWLARGLPIELHSFEPVTQRDFALAHDPAYVAGVIACRIDNGFGNRMPEVARSLPYTTGSLVSACEHVLTCGTRIACSPTSGFHHAHHARGGGFCTFNGLIVAACLMRESGLVHRVGILDCDFHYGDGTQSTIEQLGLAWVDHITMGGEFYEPGHAAAYLRRLEAAVRQMTRCDLVIYQAGADVHVADPLGGLLNDAQIVRRDGLVFNGFSAARTPLVWNLAGGYQTTPHGAPDDIEPVLAIHRRTMQACADAYVDRPA